MTQHVLKQQYDSRNGEWILVIYDDILGAVVDKRVKQADDTLKKLR